MTNKEQADELSQLLGPHAQRAEADLQRWLVEDGCPGELAEALRYSVLGGGKRLRPALVHLAAAAAGGKDGESAARSAVAIELIHCYSLVHDDLPAMDDDTMRRGRPTVHVKFGQAMAILAGDALLTRAFAVVCGTADRALASQLVCELSHAAGQSGMIAGQVADMNLCRLDEGLDGLRYTHQAKTGAIIRAAGRLGAMCGGADQAVLAAVSRYGELLGLAFQVVDDVLDVTGEATKIGKTPGKDAAAGKRTYVSLLGLDQAKALGQELTARCLEALKPLGPCGSELARLAVLLGGRLH